MKKTVFFLILIGFIVQSCDWVIKEDKGVPIARVNEKFLYDSDIKALLDTDASPLDSIRIVSGYITRWATQQLLMDGARRNISSEEQVKLENLVEQYRRDLYTQVYKDALVVKGLDSVITDAEAIRFYEENKSNFKLNENLLKLRYIQIDENNPDFDAVKKKFVRFDKDDKKFLDSIAVQFRAHFFKDSVWVKEEDIIRKINIITSENKDKYLKKIDFIQLKDSLGLYLMVIGDKLSRNQDAPLDYVMPTVKQIILNKRKLELIKQLEKDITKDAIKNDQFEIYD